MGRTALALLVLLASSVSAAAAETPAPEGLVPTTMCGPYFLIPLEVDLDDDGTPTTLRALFDTGGAGLHIDPDAVVRAGGAPVGEREQITVRQARAGPLTFRKLRPFTREMDHLSRALGVDVDVFLPFRAFREYLLTLDFPRQEMRVRRGKLPRPDGVEVFGARGSDRRPYLDLEIAGSRQRVLIDSGSSGSIGLPSGHGLPWSSPPRPATVAQGMETVVQKYVGRLGSNVGLAGITIERPLVEIRPRTALVGTDIMHRYAWTFDQRSRRVRIVAASPHPLRLPPLRGTGAVLMTTPEGYEIVRVLDDTPAARARLRVGDIVAAVDGKSLADQGCDRWNPKTQERTVFTILREGDRFDIGLDVVDIVP